MKKTLKEVKQKFETLSRKQKNCIMKKQIFEGEKQSLKIKICISSY